jgi:hypothetical protein
VVSQHSITLTLAPNLNLKHLGRDLRSPPRGKFSRLYQSRATTGRMRGGGFKLGMEVDRISDISRVTSVMS